MYTLTPEMVELLGAGVTVQVGACEGGRPVLCRGLGADVEPDGRVVVVLSGASGYELLPVVARTGCVAVVFAQPQSFRSLHVKGRDAVVGPGADWRELLERRHAAFHSQVAPYGFTLEFTRSWYEVPDEELAAIRFTPIAAWNQTPGPGAGESLALAT